MSRVPPRGGVLAVDKPVGPTSHDLVARARRALDDRRVGHTGTLDPFASGVLLLCCGPATRLSQFLVGSEKSYRAVLHLGEATDTLDPEGEVVAREERVWPTLDVAALRRGAADLVGDRMQRPPAFSAKKVGGEAAHRRARRGERVELAPVPVSIRRLEVVEIDLPRVVLETTVSAGTYVRTLAADFAAALGSCAHLRELRRTAVGPVELAQTLPFAELESGRPIPWIRPLDALGHLPRITAGPEAARRLAQGQRLAVAELESAGELPSPEVVVGSLVRLAYGDELLGIAEVERGGEGGERIRPRKIFLTPAEISGAENDR